LKNLKEYLLNFGITLLLLVIILYFFDFEKIFEIILNSNYYLIFLSLIIYFVVVLTMTYRLKIVLNELKLAISLRELLKSVLAGMIASDFTPARSGYFFVAFSLSSKLKTKINDTLLAIFGPQLFDFTIKALALTTMILFLFNYVGGLENSIFITILSIIGIFSVIGFFGALLFVNGFLENFSFVKTLPVLSKIYSLFSMMQKNSHKLMDIKWKIIGVTLFSWILKGCEWLIISQALGIDIFGNLFYDYLFIMIFQASITLIQFVPLPTIAGGGASELGFSGVLYLVGVPMEIGLAFALLTRIVMIVVDIFGIGEIIWYLKKEGFEGILKDINSIEELKD